MHKDIKEILISGEEISAKCQELAKQINEDYQGKEVIPGRIIKGVNSFFS